MVYSCGKNKSKENSSLICACRKWENWALAETFCLKIIFQFVAEMQTNLLVISFLLLALLLLLWQGDDSSTASLWFLRVLNKEMC